MNIKNISYLIISAIFKVKTLFPDLLVRMLRLSKNMSMLLILISWNGFVLWFELLGPRNKQKILTYIFRIHTYIFHYLGLSIFIKVAQNKSFENTKKEE